MSLPLLWNYDEIHTHSPVKNSTLLVMLYEPPPNDPLINRAVAWLDGPFSHVEVAFTDGMASSIYAGEKVFMHERRFANPNYTAVAVQVTQKQEADARQFCIDSAHQAVDFDGLGMYISPLPHICKRIVSMFTRRKKMSTFCSKHVVDVFQHIGMDGFMEIDSSSTTPSMVHRILQQYCTQVMATTAYKRGLLVTNGVIPVFKMQ